MKGRWRRMWTGRLSAPYIYRGFNYLLVHMSLPIILFRRMGQHAVNRPHWWLILARKSRYDNHPDTDSNTEVRYIIRQRVTPSSPSGVHLLHADIAPKNHSAYGFERHRILTSPLSPTRDTVTRCQKYLASKIEYTLRLRLCWRLAVGGNAMMIRDTNHATYIMQPSSINHYRMRG